MASQRVMLFVDYQNAYRAARSVFYDAEPKWFWEGQFNPRMIGEHIVATSPYDRSLEGVRVYRGLPSSRHDRRGYGAARAQVEAWSKLDRVTPITRPLRYPADYPASKPEEKGIDVAIAVDFVMGAVKGWYDVGVVMSLDTDLRPALESVMSELHGLRVEVAAWNRPDRHCRRLSIPGSTIWCHWLGPEVYQRAADPKDYTA